MALINRAKKEINTKIVYFGPAVSGKTATLERIYKTLPLDCRGNLKSMAVRSDRMLFFDFLPLGSGAMEGYTVRLHLYTAPGTVMDEATWKIVLKGADGVVFVADSAAGRQEANRAALEQLRGLLRDGGGNLDDMAVAIQCNKCDVAGAALPEVVADSMGAAGFEAVAASALTGEGVMPILSALTRQVLETIRRGQLEVEAGGELLLPVLEAPAEKEKAAATKAPEEKATLPAGAEPQLVLNGAPEPLGGGLIRLPLAIRYDGKEKKVALTIAITTEE